MARGRIEMIEPDWPAPDSVRAVCSTRVGGVSEAPYASLNLGDHVGDESGAVLENRARLSEVLGLSETPRWLNQIHGTVIANAEDVTAPVSADGAITSAINVVCAVMTADCLPVLLCDVTGSHVAAVHGGWRGLAAGVLEAAVSAFGARGVEPSELLCWLGPAIGPAVYEVGPDVRDALSGEALPDDGDTVALKPLRQNPANDRWLLDLYALARARLRRSGIEAIHGGNFCTYTDTERFYSQRRDGACGRQATLIWRQH